MTLNAVWLDTIAEARSGGMKGAVRAARRVVADPMGKGWDEHNQ
jgi:hypothetical protein